MDWFKSIKIFHALVKYQNFAKAAQSLDIGQSVVSKYIRWMEQQLGIKLIERTTRQFHLTAAGTEFFQRTKDFLNYWDSIKAQLSVATTQISGHLSLATSTTTGERLVLPSLAGFLLKNQQISIDYSVHNHYLDLSGEGIDLFVTTLLLPPTKLITRDTLLPLRSQLVAAPDYLQAKGTPKKIEDLIKHNCLIYRLHDQPYRWQFANGKTIEIEGNFMTNAIQSVIHAATQGLGIAFVPVAFITKELKAGQLKILMSSYYAQQYNVYAYYHRSAGKFGLVQRYLNYLTKELTKLKLMGSNDNKKNHHERFPPGRDA